MNKLKKVLMGVAALAALALGGAAIAGATGGGNDGDGELSGAVEQKAGDAALRSAGGGSVRSVETSDEGGAAVYEVKVDQAGKTLEVQVDKAFHVTATKADDDSVEGDDGETNDDK